MIESPRRGRARGLVLPLLSGALLGATFQPWGLAFFAFAAMAPFLVALHRIAEARERPIGAALRAAYRTGYAAGAGYFVLLGHWFVLLDAPQLPHRVVMLPLFALLVAYLALYPALFAVLVVLGARRTRIPFAFLAPPLWVATEWLRGSGPLGFPWGNVGYALAASGPLLQSAAWVGVNGLTLIVVGANAALAAAVTLRSRGRARAAAAAVVATAAIVVALHAAGAARLRAHPPAADPPTRVAIVQPNIPSSIKWDWEFKDRSVDAIARLLRRVPPGGVALSVWPETAIPAYLHDERGYFKIVKTLIAGTGAPALFGFPDTEVTPDERVYYNAAILVLPDGTEAGEYKKVRLVPFGEALPFQSIFPALRHVDFGEADFTPGTEYTQFEVPGIRFGVSICFEAIFPEMTRRLVNGGADVVVNITNDAWYGRSSSAWQHARMSVVRTVEDGVSLVRAANTGISLVADPYGRIVAESELFVETLLVVPLDPRRVQTFYARHGDWSLKLSLALSFLAVAGALAPIPFVARRGRRDS